MAAVFVRALEWVESESEGTSEREKRRKKGTTYWDRCSRRCFASFMLLFAEYFCMTSQRKLTRSFGRNGLPLNSKAGVADVDQVVCS